MNCSALFGTFMTFNFVSFLPRIPLCSRITKTLGHTVITTLLAREIVGGIDVPYIVVDYGVIVDDEITGVIIAGEDGFLQEQVSLMTSQSGWMARAMVVVAVIQPHPKYFRYLWKIRVINVILISTSGSFAYNPFNDTMFRVDGLDIEKVLEERWRDLQGYKIAVAMYRHNLSFRKELGVILGSGIDGSAIYELAKYWNMTIDIVDTGKHEHFVSITDRLLNDGQVDLSMNARFLGREKIYLDRPEYTPSIYADSVVIVLKIPDRLRGWAVIGRMFQWQVWLALLGALLVMNRAILVLGRATGWPNSLWSSLKALCNIPICRPPRAAPDRIILGGGFLVGVVIVTIVQASLYHSTTEGATYKRLKKIPPVIEHFQLVTDSETIKDILHYYEIKNLKSKLELKVVPLNNEVFERYAFVTRALEIQLLRRTGELRDDLYNVEEAVCNIPMTYLVKRGSPFLKRLSEFTSRVFEGGLSDVWYRMTLFRLSRGKKMTNKEDFKVLALRDVEVAFFVLVMGNLLSTIAFLLELLSKAINQGKLRKLRRYIIMFLNFMYPTTQ